MEYLNQIHAIARGLALPILEKFEVPQVGNAINVFTAVSPEIDNFIIQVKIRRGRRARGYSAVLDSTTKEKVRHFNCADQKYCGQIGSRYPKRKKRYIIG
jgi:hypothetical protein